MSVYFDKKRVTELKNKNKLPYEKPKVNKLIEEYRTAKILYYQDYFKN